MASAGLAASCGAPRVALVALLAFAGALLSGCGGTGTGMSGYRQYRHTARLDAQAATAANLALRYFDAKCCFGPGHPETEKARTAWILSLTVLDVTDAPAPAFDHYAIHLARHLVKLRVDSIVSGSGNARLESLVGGEVVNAGTTRGSGAPDLARVAEDWIEDLRTDLSASRPEGPVRLRAAERVLDDIRSGRMRLGSEGETARAD